MADNVEWKAIIQDFRNHFRESLVDKNDDFIGYDDSTSSLRIYKNGGVEAEMPLHSFSASEFEDIEFEEDLVRVKTSEVEYEFRR